MSRLLRVVVGLCLVVAGSGVLTSPALATPSSGVSAVMLAEAEIPAGLLPFVPDGVHVALREITIAPGGTTGWHYHDGDLVGVVRSGTLTHPGPDCVPTVYGPGDIIKEPRGQQNTHEGENLGDVPVVLDVVYLIPLGMPLAEDAPAPACAQD